MKNMKCLEITSWIESSPELNNLLNTRPGRLILFCTKICSYFFSLKKTEQIVIRYNKITDNVFFFSFEAQCQYFSGSNILVPFFNPGLATIT